MAKKKAKKVVRSLTVISEKETGPIKKAGNLTMQKSWIKQGQLLQMLSRTPASHVHERPGKGGQTWSYVTGNYVMKVLNYVFGWNWDFEIITQEVLEKQVITTGKLTVRSPKGDVIVKTQVGRADIKYKQGTKETLDLGNDYKASATDALKKCASMLGVASDIYGKEEFKEIGIAVRNDAPVVPGKPETKKPEFAPEAECHSCGNPMTKAEAEYSKKIMKKQLCRGCQSILRNQK
jgi:hypothetical protein